MMGFLFLDITHQFIELTVPNGEATVTSLPEKRSVLIACVLIQAEELFLIFSSSSDWEIVRPNLTAR